MVFYKEHGIASCSFGSESQPIEASYHFIKEIFSRQHPKVVLLESFKFINAQEGRPVSTMAAHRATDAFGWTKAKIGMVEDISFQGSPEEYICDLIKYHVRWAELGHGDFRCAEMRDVCRGYQLLGRIVPIIYKQWVPAEVKWDQGISCYLASWILRIRNLVESHGAKLIIFTAPFKATDGHNRFCRALKRFCAEKGLCYLNLLDKEFGPVMDGDYEFADDKDGHLNVYGAENVTRFLGSYLVRCYSLETVGLGEREAWDRDLKVYEELRFQKLREWKKKFQKKEK